VTNVDRCKWYDPNVTELTAKRQQLSNGRIAQSVSDEEEHILLEVMNPVWAGAARCEAKGG